MKWFIPFAVAAMLCGLAVYPAQATFTAIYLFGDGICATATNGAPTPYATNFYGLRRSNGRVWVEWLAERQGLTNNYWYSTNGSAHASYTNLSATTTNWSYSSNNFSFYGNYSTNVVKVLTNWPAPPDPNTALFIVWVDDADFVDDMGSVYPVYGTNIAKWTNAVNLSLTNHFRIITNLYAKGARTLIMPNAVDIMKIPQYVGSPQSLKDFVRQRVIDFNTGFAPLLSNAMVSLPGLKIYEPDIFTLVDNLITNAAAYGLTNVLSGGQSTDVLEDPGLTNRTFTGPGTNYIFWGSSDPTAKVHEIIADVVQQLIAPVQVGQISLVNGTNELDLVNVPIGLNGFVEGRTNLAVGNWTTVANITSTNTTQSVFVPSSAPTWFYRLRFPFAWTWP